MHCKLEFWVAYLVVSCGEVMVMIKMSGLSWVRHWHVHELQMQGYNHVGIVFSGGAPNYVLMFIRTMLCVVEWERSSLCTFNVAMLCLSIPMLLIVGLVHMERRWRHVSILYSGQRGKGNLMGIWYFSFDCHVLSIPLWVGEVLGHYLVIALPFSTHVSLCTPCRAPTSPSKIGLSLPLLCCQATFLGFKLPQTLMGPIRRKV